MSINWYFYTMEKACVFITGHLAQSFVDKLWGMIFKTSQPWTIENYFQISKLVGMFVILGQEQYYFYILHDSALESVRQMVNNLLSLLSMF